MYVEQDNTCFVVVLLVGALAKLDLVEDFLQVLGGSIDSQPMIPELSEDLFKKLRRIRKRI